MDSALDMGDSPVHEGSPMHEESSAFHHTSTLSFFLACLAVYSIASEAGTAALIKYMAKRHRFLLPILEATFAQLMLLGLFSCILFATNRFGGMTPLSKLLRETEHETVEKAEEVHFLVFVGLVIYIGTITTVVLVSAKLVQRWGRNEAEGLAQVAQAYTHIQEERVKRGWWAYLNPLFLYRWLDIRYIHHYHLLRAEFIAHNELPSDYNFSRYLKRCIGHCFSELVEIHWSNWVLLLCIIGINWARYLLVRYVTGRQISQDMHPQFWGAMGSAFLLGALVLYAKCQWILQKLASQANHHLLDLDLLPSGDLPSLGPPSSIPVSSEASAREDVAADEHADVPGEDGVPPVMGSTRLLSLNAVSDHRRRRRHENLFWFNRPNLLFRMIQLLLLFQSWFLALLIMFLSVDRSTWTWAQKMVCFLPSTVTALGFAPIVLPIFTLIRYVGPFARVDLIKNFEDHGGVEEMDDSDDVPHPAPHTHHPVDHGVLNLLSPSDH